MNKILFLDDYQPFNMTEICGDMQDNDAIIGLSKIKDQKLD